MNMERIHMCYYVYTSITVCFIMLGMGNFFCMRRLFDVYQHMNKKTDGCMPGFIITAAIIWLLASAMLLLQWKVGIMIMILIMALCIIAFTVIFVVVGLGVLIEFLNKYHEELKQKKGMW